MRILFDKGTPRPLRRRLFGHEVETSVERGWDTLANGVLMDRAEEAGFDVLLTTNHGPEHPIPAEHVQPPDRSCCPDEHFLAAHGEEH